MKSLSTQALLGLVGVLGLLSGLLLGSAVNPARAFGPPSGDYGDAPDGFLAGYARPYGDVVGRFPTRYDTPNSRVGGHGIVVLNPGAATLGLRVSSERGALDPGDPDGMHNMVDDDAYDDGLSVDRPLPLYLNVSLRPGAGRTTWYLNVLVDVNHDGEWRDEWFVRNQVLNLTPGASQEVELNVPPPFPPAWMRIALTSEPVDESAFADVGGWDGSGEFREGEVEDYLYGVGAFSGAGQAVEIVMDEVPPEVANRAAEAAERRMSEARAAARAISEELRRAQANASAIGDMRAEAMAMARAVANRSSMAEARAEAITNLSETTECYTVEFASRSMAEALASAFGYVRSQAEAADQALASAGAEAQSAVSAMARALADAQAAAEAIAEASARASAHAEAAAEAWAEATAHVQSHEVVGGRHFFTVSASDLSAFLNAAMRAWVEASAAVEASAEAEAHAQAIASATTSMEAAAEAISMAWAQAQAATQAAASAEAALESLTQVTAGVEAYLNAVISEECCTCEECPPCPPSPGGAKRP